MKSKHVGTYFDTHSHYSAYNKNPEYYSPIISHLSSELDKNIQVMDVGCGDGSFLKGLISEEVNGIFIGIDISFNLLLNAKKNLDGYQNVHLIVADAFNLPFKSNEVFNLVHIDSVLHHLIDKNRSKSIRLSIELLHILMSKLKNNGLLIVEEMYYNSKGIPFITSSIIFYSLKFINFAHIDLTFIRRDLKPGLEVNFFHERQLIRLLNKLGSTEVIRRIPSNISKLEKLLFLSDRGHITYFVRA